VIVTRNRPEALALSLPLHLAQSRLPEAVIVIDSSDDPGPNRALVARLGAASPVPVSHHASPPGMTVQRNIGLAMVATEVVFFPDDDSLVLPGALAAMLRIYDRDTAGRIGGVCAAAALAPPPGVLDAPGQGAETAGAETAGAETAGAGTAAGGAYRMRLGDRIRAQVIRPRRFVEDRLVPTPFHLVAARKQARLPAPPAWLGEENAITVPWMGGFRMSFRTAVVARRGFDEALGRYALFEDIDAGFGVLDTHLLIGARNALIYHHKAPERRANGRALGAMQILNHAYVVARSGETDAGVRRALDRFAAWKVAQYALGALGDAGGGGGFGRDRLAGARAARAVIGTLLDTPPALLADRYRDLRAACFASED
jgi:hypothetical protein